MSSVFLDSNILVYAATQQDPRKQGIAAVILEHLKEHGNGCISLQVLREFANVMYRKSNYTHEQIKEMVDGFHEALPCVVESKETLDRGMELKAKYGLQLYDAMMLATAESVGCDTVYSEDMGDGAVYDGIVVKNPFRDDVNGGMASSAQNGGRARSRGRRTP